MKTLIPLATGFEEIEAVTLIDVLRRAEWDVVTAGLESGVLKASRGVQLLPDLLWNEVDLDAFDLILLPGGWGGAMALCEHAGVQQALQDFYDQDKWIGAICAAPLALQKAGILDGKRFTCYPSVAEHFPETNQPLFENEVEQDGKIVTSQGPGTALELALQLIAICDSLEKSTALRFNLLLK